MAIGSAPEIGETFKTGFWPKEEADAWRAEVGGDLLGGYARLCYADPSRKARIDKEWADANVHVPV